MAFSFPFLVIGHLVAATRHGDLSRRLVSAKSARTKPEVRRTKPEAGRTKPDGHLSSAVDRPCSSAHLYPLPATCLSARRTGIGPIVRDLESPVKALGGIFFRFAGSPPPAPGAWDPFPPENLQHSTLNIEHRKVPKRFTSFVGGSTLNVRCWTLGSHL